MNVPPRLTHHDLVNARQVDAVIGRDSAKRFAFGAATTNVPYGIFGQLRESVSLASGCKFRMLAQRMIAASKRAFRVDPLRMTVAAGAAAFSGPILVVVAHGADPEMVRPDAGRVVASMENAGRFSGDRAKRHLPGYPVRASIHSKKSKPSISVPVAAFGPDPALTGLVDLCPKVSNGILPSSHRRVSSLQRDSGGQRSPAAATVVGLAVYSTTGGAICTAA